MIAVAILSMAILGTLGGFFICWPLAIAHTVLTGRLLPWTPRRHVPWSFFDLLFVVLLAFSVLVFLSVVLGQIVPRQANPAAPLRNHELAVLVDTAWKVSVMALATLYLVIKARASLRDLGWSAREFGQNVLIGIVTFAMVAPPVYAVQAAIVYWGNWKYEHPLIDMLQKTPDLWLFSLLTVSACIMAPLSEEWFFRVLLQGWLERAFAWLKRKLDAEAPAVYAAKSAVLADISDGNQAGAVVSPPLESANLNLYATPAAIAIQLPAPTVEEAREEPVHFVLVHWVPILLSSVLFGLAHFGHGPAPIPLTLLALGLGYVYQRTHSIVPVIVVHALFNGLSMLVFYVGMFAPHLLNP